MKILLTLSEKLLGQAPHWAGDEFDWAFGPFEMSADRLMMAQTRPFSDDFSQDFGPFSGPPETLMGQICL